MPSHLAAWLALGGPCSRHNRARNSPRRPSAAIRVSVSVGPRALYAFCLGEGHVDIAAAILLVTWIIPAGTRDQPNVVNNYQSVFASADACEAARGKILQDAQRINVESRKSWAYLGPLAAMHDVHVSAVCADSGSHTKRNIDETMRVVPFPGWEAFRVPSEMSDDDVKKIIFGLQHKAEYKWLRMAAELGVAEAQADIGLRLFDKDHRHLPDEVPADAKEGLKWLNNVICFLIQSKNSRGYCIRYVQYD
jgi:hypothetical protein